MFRIDLSLLCGIFGATLSYLVIVPQLWTQGKYNWNIWVLVFIIKI
jgi:hypothetical protein